MSSGAPFTVNVPPISVVTFDRLFVPLPSKYIIRFSIPLSKESDEASASSKDPDTVTFASRLTLGIGFKDRVVEWRSTSTVLWAVAFSSLLLLISLAVISCRPIADEPYV